MVQYAFVAALLAPALQEPADGLWQTSVSRQLLSTVEVVAIVRAEGPAATEKRTLRPMPSPGQDPTEHDIAVGVERFKVVSGSAPDGEQLLQVVFPTGMAAGSTQWRQLSKSQSYVLLGRKPRNGSFQLDRGDGVLANVAHLDATAEDDLVALVLIPTKHDELPISLSGADLATAALIDTLDSASEATYRRVVRLLALAPPQAALRPSALDPPKIGVWNHDTRTVDTMPNPDRRMVQYCPPGPITERLARKLEDASPYGNSKIHELLLRWRVPGVLNDYMASLEPLLRVPGAYEVPGENTYTSGLIDELYPYTHLDGPAERYDLDQYARALLGATNKTLFIYWLTKTGPKEGRTIELYSRLAPLLDSQDQMVVYELMAMMSNNLADPAGKPKAYTYVDGVEVLYPDLEEKRVYWKKKLDIRAKPR